MLREDMVVLGSVVECLVDVAEDCSGWFWLV